MQLDFPPVVVLAQVVEHLRGFLVLLGAKKDVSKELIHQQSQVGNLELWTLLGSAQFLKVLFERHLAYLLALKISAYLLESVFLASVDVQH